MIGFTILVLPIALILIWLFFIRPYCIRNKKSYITGANFAVAFWIDWQNAKEIAKSKNDTRMLYICNLFLTLQILFVILLAALTLS